MNEIQKELLKILEPVLSIFEELNLTWYLANGSALGAKKYGGFIPWDDDIDITMPRKDYEIFCQKAQGYLPEHLFLQNYKTDPQFPFFYTKIRNSNTTFIETNVRSRDMNHGLYIDIFPLDYYPDGALAQKILWSKVKAYRWLQLSAFDNSKALHYRVLRKLGVHRRTNRVLSAMERMVKKVGSQNCLSCDYGDRQDKGILPWDHYAEGTEAQFEYLTVKVPSKIDAYLTYKYGDWEKELPMELQVSHHNTEVCDLSRPYVSYRK